MFAVKFQASFAFSQQLCVFSFFLLGLFSAELLFQAYKAFFSITVLLPRAETSSRSPFLSLQLSRTSSSFVFSSGVEKRTKLDPYIYLLQHFHLLQFYLDKHIVLTFE
ncbi:hypothetical protein V6N13_096558 [Hibiscus sabdariffa]